MKGFTINTKDIWKSKRKIGFGYIMQCNLDDDFGIIYGVESHEFSLDYINWLYYFKKDKGYILSPMTIVSFVCAYDYYRKKEEILVSDINPIDDYIIVDDKENKGEKLREDGLYHSEIVWTNMDHLSKMIVINEFSVSVYYPWISNVDETVYYLKQNYFDDKDEDPRNIVTCYVRVKDFERYKKSISFSTAANVLKDMIASVEATDIKKVSKLFQVRDSGYFQYRPGRDDHFIFCKSRISKCEDSYINSLKELGVVDKDYYCCVGRGIDDKDYDRMNKEETFKMRKEIVSKYNQDDHFDFLLSEYVLGNINKQNNYFSYLAMLKEFGNSDEIKHCMSKNRELKDWFILIKEHNKH